MLTASSGYSVNHSKTINMGTSAWESGLLALNEAHKVFLISTDYEIIIYDRKADSYVSIAYQ